MVDMEDLNQEHEVNKYLLKEEKDLKERLGRSGLTKAEIEGESQTGIARERFHREEESSYKPKQELKTLDQVSQRERELLEQLQQLQKIKSTMKDK